MYKTPSEIINSGNAKAFSADGEELKELEEVVEVRKRVIEENEWFRAELEEVNSLLYIHVTFFEFTPTAFRYVKKRWKDLLEIIYWSGYDSLFSYTMNEKFANKLDPNYERAGHVEIFDERYEVIRWQPQLYQL